MNSSLGLRIVVAFFPVMCALAARADGSETNEPEWMAYVRLPEGYQWKLDRRAAEGDTTRLEISLSSQVWHGAPWKHQLSISAPARSAAPDLAVIFIDRVPPSGTAESPLLGAVHDTGVLCASVNGVYQACFGATAGEGIAKYAVQQFIATGDPTWSPFAPVAKTMVRAMDAISEATARELGTPVKRFILTGFSKMGMAAWVAAAVDGRVVGIVPLGADALNMPGQAALKPTAISRFLPPGFLDTERGAQFVRAADPYLYRARLAMPKLIVSGSNDENYFIGSVGAYFDGLPGPKWNLFLPNQTHGSTPTTPAIPDNPRVRPATVAFVRALAAGRPLPALDWSFREEGGALRLKLSASAKGASARLWSTDKLEYGTWTESAMAAGADGAFAGEVARPAGRALAAFGEIVFEPDGGRPYSLTTGIHVCQP